MRIVILTLTGQRDKYIDHMLADAMRGYGHDVNVYNYIQAGRESVCYKKPDLIVHPMVGGQYKQDFVRKCHEWGVKVVVRRGEAGMGRAEFAKLDDNRTQIVLGGWDYSPYVDLELVWGKEFADILAEQGPMPSEKIKVCGAFAFDPYLKNGEAAKRKEHRQRTILFATGFSTADCRSDYCECGLPRTSNYHKEIYALHRRSRDTWIESITELVNRFGGEWRFELKVRPGEMTEEYVQKLPVAVKIHPVTSVSSEVLKGVDVLVHSGSTLAIEAHLLGIPSFNYCNVNPDPLLSKVSPCLDCFQTLEFHLSRVAVHHSNIDEGVYADLQRHLYGKIDGRACERAAGYIQAFVESGKWETDIPNSWPKEVLHHTDKDNIHIHKQVGDEKFLCPCCRNEYYVVAGIQLAQCPYCSMGIYITKAEEYPQPVLR